MKNVFVLYVLCKCKLYIQLGYKIYIFVFSLLNRAKMVYFFVQKFVKVRK